MSETSKHESVCDKAEVSRSQGAAALVMPEDHENGFKEVEVVFRNGCREFVRLTAPPARKVMALAEEIEKTGDADPLIRACLPPDFPFERMQRAKVTSFARVENICLVLALGEDVEKKIPGAEAILIPTGSAEPGAPEPQDSSP